MILKYMEINLLMNQTSFKTKTEKCKYLYVQTMYFINLSSVYVHCVYRLKKTKIRLKKYHWSYWKGWNDSLEF